MREILAGVLGFDHNHSFDCMQDEEVVGLARSGSPAATEFLMSRYRPLVETKARAYFVMGADRDDVIQEGMIGLFKAIRDFREDRLTRFRPFAELCVTRQIITAVKTATRQKHVPLNAYVSLNRSITQDADTSLIDVIPSTPAPTTEVEIALDKLPENLREMSLSTLSELEREVLKRYLEGMSYREMSKQLQCHTKSVDNALQRVKRKIAAFVK